MQIYSRTNFEIIDMSLNKTLVRVSIHIKMMYIVESFYLVFKTKSNRVGRMSM